ncbi:MAG: hypothetical protein QM737_18665 [Ferruginibacter sp.]
MGGRLGRRNANFPPDAKPFRYTKLFMKSISTILTFFIVLYLKAQTNDSLITKYYSNGVLKEKGYLNKKKLKSGEFTYYSENGNLDSSSIFKNGKLNGITKIFYSEDDVFFFEYKNNLLISHKIYDSIGRLKYESPLPFKPILRTKFKFASGRLFYDHLKTDTLIVNNDIPFMNQNIYFPGATVTQLDHYSWIIKNWQTQPHSSNVKMVVVTSEFGVDDSHVFQKHKLIKEETILIPVK